MLFYRFSGKSDFKSFATNQNTTITIKAHTADLFISGTDSDTLKIESNKAGSLDYSINGNAITISLSDRKYFADGFLSVELPKGIKSVKLETNIGDLDIASIEVDSISMETYTGDIEIINLKANDVDIKSDIGNVEMSNSNIDGSIDINLSTGDMTLEQTDFSNLVANTYIGDIEIYSGKFSSVDATTSTGDISIDMNSQNGDITYSIGQFGNAYLFGEHFTEKENKKTFGNGTPKISLSTTIGEIEVKD